MNGPPIKADRRGYWLIELLVVVAGGGALIVRLAMGLSTLAAAGAAFCIGIAAGLILARTS